jgi:hypothetical protein
MRNRLNPFNADIKTADVTRLKMDNLSPFDRSREDIVALINEIYASLLAAPHRSTNFKGTNLKPPKFAFTLLHLTIVTISHVHHHQTVLDRVVGQLRIGLHLHFL